MFHPGAVCGPNNREVGNEFCRWDGIGGMGLEWDRDGAGRCIRDFVCLSHRYKSEFGLESTHHTET